MNERVNSGGLESNGGGKRASNAALTPLGEPTFRRIWSTSLLSNFGQLIFGVGVAWEMTRLTDSAILVALVQTSLMLPLMLVTLPAGAIADTFDRRKVAILGLAVAAFFCFVMASLTYLELASPWLLLAITAAMGVGVALYIPAWQSSISEQVKPSELPAAIALNSISYNVARSIGPALGGMLVLVAGAATVFSVSAVCYLPLIVAYFLWRRPAAPSRLPPEHIVRAIVSGLRYATHSQPIRTVLVRAFALGFASYSAMALAPLVAKDLLTGDAAIFGMLLGSSGIGAVIGAFSISIIRDRFEFEKAFSLIVVTGAIGLVAIGLSRSPVWTCLGFFLLGGATTCSVALLNIAVQLSAPRWVMARSLSLFTSALTGGVAAGAWLWGTIANNWSVEWALLASSVAMLLLSLFSLFLRIPDIDQAGAESVDIDRKPEAKLAVTMRSGPVIVEIDYPIALDDARAFYEAMLELRRTRLRNGAFYWSITRDIAEPTLWTERFHLSTWGDYLRMRDRVTQADVAAQKTVDVLILEDQDRCTRRGLERPFGSVRWQPETPDPGVDSVPYVGP